LIIPLVTISEVESFIQSETKMEFPSYRIVNVSQKTDHLM